MDTKDLHEQRVWERYAHYLDKTNMNEYEAIKYALLDVKFFENEIKARLEH